VEKKDIIEKLESLDLPELDAPAHRQNLRRALLSSGCLQKRQGGALSAPFRRFRRVISMKSKLIVIVPALVLLFAVAGVIPFFTGEQTSAYLTLQVNPSLQLALDKNNTVIGIEGLNEDGSKLLAKLDVADADLKKALGGIIDALVSEGFLVRDAEVVIALRPANDPEADGLSDLGDVADVAGEAAEDALAASGMAANVVSVVISNELYEAASAKGLLPEDYADLIEAGISPKSVEALLVLIGESKNAGVEPEKLHEEFETIVAAAIDMAEAGIAESVIVDALKGALKADPGLEELTTITAALIDMHEAGISSENYPALLNLDKELGLDKEKFLEEFSTITAALIDMHEAGIAGNVAMATLREAIKADIGLEELTTIVSAMIDIKEDGLSEADALAKLKEAIKADPTLDTFDDVIEGKADDRQTGDSSKDEDDEPATDGKDVKREDADDAEDDKRSGDKPTQPTPAAPAVEDNNEEVGDTEIENEARE